MIRSNLLVCVFFLAITVSGCHNQQDTIRECVGTQVKGWSKLLQEDLFTPLTHRRKTKYDPLAGASELSFSDANYAYDRMLTLTLSYPEGPVNRFSPMNACISEISFIVRQPGDDLSSRMLLAVFKFLEDNGLPQNVMLDVRAASETAINFAVIGHALGAEVGAGFINHVRGRFFVVRIKSLNPFTQS
jgi:hypothetical protein